MANYAIPDALESPECSLSTYEDVKTFIDSAWDCVRPTIEQDVERAQCVCRYTALRWARPRPRRPPVLKSSDVAVTIDEPEPDDAAEQTPWSVPGQIIIGYATYEWDRSYGTIFVKALVPWQTADSASSNALAPLTGAVQRIVDDREAEASLRRAVGESDIQIDALLPPIAHLWTLVFFDKSHRQVAAMQRRGWQLLDDYLEAHPAAPVEAFPPFRQATRPDFPGWLVLVRPLGARFS